MEEFSSLLSALAVYRQIIFSVVLTMAVILALMFWWDRVRYFMLGVGYGLPVFGRIARMSAKPQSPEVGSDGVTWYKSESTLCAAYYSHYVMSSKSAEFYDNCKNYLSKVGELGRSEKSWFVKIGIIALVLFEAVGFAYVLAPYMARNVSANTATWLAWVIAIMLSIVLVPLTHQMGKEIHKNGLLAKARIWYENERRDGNAEGFKNDPKINLETTYDDDHKPNYVQIINRVQANGRGTRTWYWTVISVVLIAIIAVGAYEIRALTVDGMETEQVNSSAFGPGASESAFDLPAEAQADNRAADKQAASEVMASQIAAYKLTFVILSVIFIGVQIIGIMIGYLFSFVGIESAAAVRYMQGFSSADEFADHFRQIRDRVGSDAQSYLHDLQERIDRRHDTAASRSDGVVRGTFAAYVTAQELKKQAQALKQQQDALDRYQRGLQQEAMKDAMKTQFRAPAAAAPVAPPPIAAAPAFVAPAAAAQAPVAEAVPATPVAAAEPASAPLAAGHAARIAQLGDISSYSDEQLTRVAAALNIDPALLVAERNVQRLIAGAAPLAPQGA